MKEQLEFILRHGYVVLFALNLGEQLGLPLPSGTALLAAGALAKAGRLSAAAAVALAFVAALLGHTAWFYAGRRGGNSVLRFICKISINPDSCVRRTNDFFGRWGEKSLLLAPFIPGFATVAPPLAGLSGMSLPRFLLWDGLGALLWGSSLVGAGYVLGPALETVMQALLPFGSLLAALLVLALAAWIGFKLYQRQKLFTELDVPRIDVDELHGLRLREEPHTIVDLRHALEIENEPVIIPGAISIGYDELEARFRELPREHEVIFYCS